MLLETQVETRESVRRAGLKPGQAQSDGFRCGGRFFDRTPLVLRSTQDDIAVLHAALPLA